LYVHFQPMSSVQPPSGTRSVSGTELPERSRRFVFGSCSLDTRSLELTVSGGLVKLERKPLEVPAPANFATGSNRRARSGERAARHAVPTDTTGSRHVYRVP
jgi:hypothetical protein